jgi:hypothetical protein
MKIDHHDRNPGMRSDLVEQRSDARRLSLEAISAAAGLHPAVVKQFVTYGLLEPADAKEQVLWFEMRTLSRLKTIRRLRADLGINLPGVAVVLDLLERMERIETLQRDAIDLRRKQGEIRHGET